MERRFNTAHGKYDRIHGWLKSRTLSQVIVAAGVGTIGVYMLINSMAATGGSFTLAPQTSTVNVGDTFTVALHEDSGTDTVNALQADLTYSSNLQYVGIDYSTSAFDVQAQSVAGGGSISIARGKTGGTVTGDQVVAVITFKAVSAGNATVSFGCINATGSCPNGNALVRSTDNTNILTNQTDGSYVVNGAQQADTIPPSVPSGLNATSHTSSSIAVSWTASTDNVGVTGYKVFRDGTQIGTSTTPDYADSNLSAGTSYSYTVAAYDAAGNTSAQSSPLAIMTDASGGSVGVAQASMYLSPSTQTIANGSTVNVDIVENSGSTPVNAIQGTVDFPAGQFRYVSLSANPAFAAFPSPVISGGKVSFAAGSTSPLTGTHTVATLTLEATGAGTGALSLENICQSTTSATCSAVIDTNAANILTSVNGASLSVPGTTSSGSAPAAGGTNSSGGGTGASHSGVPSGITARKPPISSNVAHSASSGSVSSNVTDSSSASQNSPSTENTGGSQATTAFGVTVKLHISDDRHQSLAHVRVSLAGDTVYTDVTGTVMFRNVPPGSRQVSIKVGSKTTTRMIQVAENGASSDKPQQFDLVAARGPNIAPYLIGGAGVLAVLALFFNLLPRMRRLPAAAHSLPAVSDAPPTSSAGNKAVPTKQPATHRSRWFRKNPDLPPGTVVPPEDDWPHGTFQ